jgi:hypothetical protein
MVLTPECGALSGFAPQRTDAAMVLISSSSATSDIALIGDDMYSVLGETHTLGYVYKVGNVFVALKGRDFGHAVEIGQTLSWLEAIEIVRSA